MSEKSSIAIVIATIMAAISMPFLACSSGPSPEQAKANFCTSLDKFHQNVSTLQSVSSGTSVDQLRTDVNNVKTSFDDVKKNASQVKGANTDNLQSAVNGLQSAISNVAGDATVAQALSSINTQLSGVATAWDQLASSYQCS